MDYLYLLIPVFIFIYYMKTQIKMKEALIKTYDYPMKKNAQRKNYRKKSLERQY